MKYPVDTPSQLRMLLRALRRSRGLSQAQAGALLGVTQQRLAQIEARPEVATFDTMLRLIALLKGRMYIEEVASEGETTRPRKRGTPRSKRDLPAGEW